MTAINDIKVTLLIEMLYSYLCQGGYVNVIVCLFVCLFVFLSIHEQDLAISL